MTKPQIEWVVKSPLYIEKNLKGDKWYLNLNNYRNAHYQTLNNIKIKYKKQMEPVMKGLPRFTKISVTFNIYASSKRLFDIGNVRSVTEKFFLDTLVELGYIEDDNYLFNPETHTYFIEVNKEDPRVDVIIKEIK